MTPDAFITKWKASTLKERSAAQEFFIELCHLLGEPTPSSDPTGAAYCFERGALKTTGAKGWADVWKRGHFAWENKGKGADLQAAFAQLQKYAIALENPPLLVVCDLDRFRIHTNWTNTVSDVHELALDDLRDPATRQKLKAVFSDPERLRPGLTRQALTEHAASDFAKLAQRLRDRGHAPETVAHFIQRLVFCMFAEDVGLLPDQLFSRMLMTAKAAPARFQARASELFGAMRSGGEAAWVKVEWFNGGLFDDDTALPLDKEDIEIVAAAAALDWADIDPTIFGTLFERGLDPSKRSQLGAHYTDRAKIMLIIEPVIVRPLLAEWEEQKQAIAEALGRSQAGKTSAARRKGRDAAVSLYRAFLARLRAFTVLDPACGSGNFLYLALLALKDLEQRVMIEAETLDPTVLPREFPSIGPAAVKGIEINSFAAELARITVWIGEIQWMRQNGWDVSRNPILKPLHTIECRDALLNADGTEAEWPIASVIIGNPPFLGGKIMRRSLGSEYVDRVFKTYTGRVPAEADFVAYWFLKSHQAVVSGSSTRFGLVSTNSIRDGASRRLIDRLVTKTPINEAWSDEPWVLDGASVRVSIICFGSEKSNAAKNLNGVTVSSINTDLTGDVADLTAAKPLIENGSTSFQGVTKGGPFEVTYAMAKNWLRKPKNPNKEFNSKVLRPIISGGDIVKGRELGWVVDFTGLNEYEASLYELPFFHILNHVKPFRANNRRPLYRDRWWLFAEARPGLRSAVSKLNRYIATPKVAKHRVFVFLHNSVIPDNLVIAIARYDETTLGILSSRFHEKWALEMGSTLEDRPTYTPTATFQTYPFPQGLTPNLPAEAYVADPRAVRIANAMSQINELRNNWINPADLVNIEAEVRPGYPDRVVPKDEDAAAVLKTLTLTNLYNKRPTWLDNAHRELDAAVAAAYGWPEDIADDDALARLLALNLSRAAGQSAPALPVAEADAEREDA